MRFSHTIVSTNRPDLLARAVESVRPLWRFVSILDNSPDASLSRDSQWPVPILRPSVPLSCAQSMNFLHRLARERGLDAFGYQHEDAEAGPQTAERFAAAIEAAHGAGRNWATIFTHYDLISAYRTAAVDAIGPWDTNFPCPNYHHDCDWFYRAKLKGYELIETKLEVTHMDGGSVTVKDPARQRIAQITFPLNDAYYVAKWGGRQHEERFTSPWNQAR